MLTPESIAKLKEKLADAEAGKLAWESVAEFIFAAGRTITNASVTLDRDRSRRNGFPEVIYGEGKSVASICHAASELLLEHDEVLVTRLDHEFVQQIGFQFPHHLYNDAARTLRLAKREFLPTRIEDDAPYAVVISAGTTDRAVAQEAVETLAWMRVPTVEIEDCGVAGLYRLLGRLDQLRNASVVIVVAGMEGALASVVGGLVPCPVIAVPTSVGYGANLQGITTVLAMLSSCAASVTTVNINAGFKGGYIAGLIYRQITLFQTRNPS